jgi:phospholipid transport system substrate-binding protein
MRISFAFLIALFAFGHCNASYSAEKNEYEYVSNIVDPLFKILKDKSIKKSQHEAIIRRDFISQIDFEWSSRAVIGKEWNELASDKKEKFINAYRDFLLSTWVPRMSMYNNQKYEILKSVDIINDKYSDVKLLVYLSENHNAEILIRILKSQGSYKIINFSIEGIDMTKTYRVQFTPILEKEGIDGLIKYLENKTKENNNRKS